MSIFEKIIERLEEISELIRPVGWSRKIEVVEMKAIIEIINEVAAEHNNGWIPCSERLPETEEYILLSFENFSVPQIGRYEQDDFGGAFYLGDELTTCTWYELFVNAWKPLPKPYQHQAEPETSKELKIKLEDVLQIIINNLETEKMKSYLNIDKLMEELLRKAKETSYGRFRSNSSKG